MIYLFKTNVLRNSNTEIKGKLSLRSSYSNDFFNMPDKIFQEQEELEKKVLEAKEEYKRVIEEANENSKVIEKKAYELGYEQGLKNGYEDGYKESYEQNIEKALKESEEIKQEGYNTLLNIKNEAKSYIKENKESIISISISIAEQVLREKFKDVTLMETMLNNIITEYDLKKDLVIKVNPLYKEELQKNIDEEISKNNLSQKIFIIPDLGVEEGNAVIETESGKLIVGIDSVLDKVKEELL